MSPIDFQNSTDLGDERLLAMCEGGATGWFVGPMTLRVRYSRGADFSGTCFYVDRRIFVNLGRHLVFPYLMETNLARVRTMGRQWQRPIYTLELRNGYELVVFVFMHELYHLLVKQAGRNTRQKESMCDRFAARHLVDQLAAVVRDESGERVPRGEWDFQDLDAFVAAARTRRAARRPTIRRGMKLRPGAGRHSVVQAGGIGYRAAQILHGRLRKPLEASGSRTWDGA